MIHHLNTVYSSCDVFTYWGHISQLTLEGVQTKMESKLLANVLVLLSIFVQVSLPLFIIVRYIIHKLQPMVCLLETEGQQLLKDYYNTMVASLLSQTKISTWKLSESTKHGFPVILLVKTNCRVLLSAANSPLLRSPQQQAVCRTQQNMGQQNIHLSTQSAARLCTWQVHVIWEI